MTVTAIQEPATPANSVPAPQRVARRREHVLNGAHEFGEEGWDALNARIEEAQALTRFVRTAIETGELIAHPHATARAFGAIERLLFEAHFEAHELERETGGSDEHA